MIKKFKRILAAALAAITMTTAMTLNASAATLRTRMETISGSSNFDGDFDRKYYVTASDYDDTIVGTMWAYYEDNLLSDKVYTKVTSSVGVHYATISSKTTYATDDMGRGVSAVTDKVVLSNDRAVYGAGVYVS